MYFKPRIFISSTMGDKSNLRQKIKKMFETAGAEVALYEKDLTPSVNFNTYREDILQTDFVIFIIDERYGNKTASGISGTEEEFNIAIRNHLPCHFYLKETEKTADALQFEKNIKSKGTSYYFYKSENDLLKKLNSTCFTIARDICMSKLQQQKIEPNVIAKLAVDRDYQSAISYLRIFEKLIEIQNNSSFDMENSNLTIELLGEPCRYFLSNKNHFIDKKLESLFYDLFSAVDEIVSFIADNSTPSSDAYPLTIQDETTLFLRFNRFINGYNHEFLSSKRKELADKYNLTKAYVASMKLESSLL